MRACGVNFPDVLLSRGLYQFKPAPPFVPGCEAAGVVRAVGDGVTSIAPGDRVAAMLLNRAFAEQIRSIRTEVAIQVRSGGAAAADAGRSGAEPSW